MIYLVRHGRTEANATGRLQGRLDLPLDEVGLQQAAALVGAVPQVDRLITSPSQRARQTGDVFGVESEIDERWLEMDFGELDGALWSDVPRDVMRAWTSDSEYAPSGGESLRVVAARVGEACAELLDAAHNAHVVVVSHATPIKLAMAWALGVDPGIVWRSHVDQASVTRVSVGPRGPALATFNLVPSR